VNSIFLFVDSERADQYLNSIVHCVLRLDVRRIAFIHIRGLVGSRDSADGRGVSGRTMGAVQAQLEGLAERGEYLFTAEQHAGQRHLLVDIYGPERALEIQTLYRQCRNTALEYSNEEIEYGDLRQCMRRIARLGAGTYIDVTAIKKRYLGDLVAAGLVEGIQGLYTFDLVGARPNFDEPWRMLIHDLDGRLPSAFTYTNILNTPVYQACVRLVALRAPALRATIGATVALLVAVAAAAWYFGPESGAIRTLFAISGIASILSLVFVFMPPRGAR
jgi:hypothetical protein